MKHLFFILLMVVFLPIYIFGNPSTANTQNPDSLILSLELNKIGDNYYTSLLAYIPERESVAYKLSDLLGDNLTLIIGDNCENSTEVLYEYIIQDDSTLTFAPVYDSNWLIYTFKDTIPNELIEGRDSVCVMMYKDNWEQISSTIVLNSMLTCEGIPESLDTLNLQLHLVACSISSKKIAIVNYLSHAVNINIESLSLYFYDVLGEKRDFSHLLTQERSGQIIINPDETFVLLWVCDEIDQIIDDLGLTYGEVVIFSMEICHQNQQYLLSTSVLNRYQHSCD